ncbi:MAG: DUF2947 family protein [Rhodocyclaceae bacterium]|nr:DUF2947 family protein [Rhodocyclaceae bacterium]
MISVRLSPIALFFDDVQACDDAIQIKFLDLVEAAQVWETWFDRDAKGLYDLPIQSWVVQTPWAYIGTWIESFNCIDRKNELPSLIAGCSSWKPENKLLLVQNRENMVSLSFEGFVKHWHALLAAFDDGPLLMSETVIGEPVFCFTPIGNVLKANPGSFV